MEQYSWPEQLYWLTDIQHKLSKQAGFAIKNSFADFAKKDLAAHGSRMFAFISKESKAHLCINNTIHPSYSHNPDAHLHTQTQTWAPRWHPCNHELNNTLSRLLLRIRTLAKTASAQSDSNYNTESLDNSTNSYKKDTKGGDAWSNTPTRVKERLATSIRYSTKKAVQPIQNMLNLHPLLGKPGGGSRTICKTPMLYRHTLRGREQVGLWEDNNTGSFDTAGKGKSALLAAAYRSIKAEVYGQTEDQVIAVFHDFEKIFDTIDTMGPWGIQSAQRHHFVCLRNSMPYLFYIMFTDCSHVRTRLLSPIPPPLRPMGLNM